MTLTVNACLQARRTMRKWHVVVRNVVEEVDLVLIQEKTRGDGMHRGVTPSLVEETTVTIQGLEEVDVRLASEPIKVADLEVGPLRLVSVS